MSEVLRPDAVLTGFGDWNGGVPYGPWIPFYEDITYLPDHKTDHKKNFTDRESIQIINDQYKSLQSRNPL